METIHIDITVRACSMDELSAADRQLVEQAKQATANSYANYSHFHVGAALRLADGSIQIGANQENAAFSSGLCAERSAIFAAQAMHPEHAITALAIAACNANGFTQEPVTPCGACRQVILEMEDRYQSPVRILLYGQRVVYCLESVRDLMPLSFVDKNMHI